MINGNVDFYKINVTRITAHYIVIYTVKTK